MPRMRCFKHPWQGVLEGSAGIPRVCWASQAAAMAFSVELDELERRSFHGVVVRDVCTQRVWNCSRDPYSLRMRCATRRRLLADTLQEGGGDA